MIPLIKGQRNSRYDYRDNLPVNMTAVAEQIEGDSGYLLAHDGLKEFATTSGKARGGYFNERLNTQFRVSGGSLESIAEDGTATVVGQVLGSAPCSFAESFNTQAVVSDGKFYLYDGYRITQVSDPNVSVPIDLVWFRGIYVLTDGETLYNTELTNEQVISPLNYVSSEFAADPIKGLLRTDSNQIVAFNRFSTEWFTFNANAPAGTSVLAPIQGKSSTIGIVGTHCKTFLDGQVFILGGRKSESPSVHIMNGAQEVTVATREIDKIIAKYTENELAVVEMESRTVDRDKFVIIHLPNETLLYNHTIGSKMGTAAAWTILKTGEDEPWRGRYGVFDPRVGKWVYGDTKDNKLATLDDESFAQYGEAQELLFYTPILPFERQVINSIELDTIPGYTENDASVGMSVSYDSVAWGQEHWTVVSRKFGYGTNYIVRRMGYVSRAFSLRFRFVSKDKMAFSGLEINAE